MRSLNYAVSSMRSVSTVLPMVVVVQNLHQEVRMHSNEHPDVWQRRLRFNEEEVWAELPESVREHCRTLWRQMLVSVLQISKRGQDERED